MDVYCLPCRDQCGQGQHGHCTLCNFQGRIVFRQCVGQQPHRVDCFSSVEALRNINK